MQTGHVYQKKNKKSNGSWYLRYREKGTNGNSHLVAKQIAPAEYSYREARRLADEFLSNCGVNTGKLKAESIMTLGHFVNHFWLPHVDSHMKPSTRNGYRHVWYGWLEPECGQIRLRDMKKATATQIVEKIAKERQFVISNARKLKWTLVSILNLAVDREILEFNPIRQLKLPRCKPSEDSYAYSLEEINHILNLLSGRNHAIAATFAFTGVRPGELRGLRWENFNGSEIRVTHSVWNRDVDEPKTKNSKATIPIIPLLADILTGYRKAIGEPESGWLFEGRPGKPIDLHNLANRTIRALLKDRWHGWYAFRRGLATNLYRMGIEAKTIQGILRHSRIQTTLNYYVQPVPEAQVQALQQLGEMFTRCSPDGRVN